MCGCLIQREREREREEINLVQLVSIIRCKHVYCEDGFDSALLYSFRLHSFLLSAQTVLFTVYSYQMTFEKEIYNKYCKCGSFKKAMLSLFFVLW